MSDVVSNASPLIVLAKADLLKILPALFSGVLVPQAVLMRFKRARPTTR